MFHSVKRCRQFSDLFAHVSAFQKIQRHNQYGTSDPIGYMTLISATLKVNNFSYICPISVKLSSVKEALLAGPKLLWGWNYPLKTRKKPFYFRLIHGRFLQLQIIGIMNHMTVKISNFLLPLYPTKSASALYASMQLT